MRSGGLRADSPDAVQLICQVGLLSTIPDKAVDLVDAFQVTCFKASRVVQNKVLILARKGNRLPDLFLLCPDSTVTNSCLYSPPSLACAFHVGDITYLLRRDAKHDRAYRRLSNAGFTNDQDAKLVAVLGEVVERGAFNDDLGGVNLQFIFVIRRVQVDGARSWTVVSSHFILFNCKK